MNANFDEHGTCSFHSKNGKPLEALRCNISADSSDRSQIVVCMGLLQQRRRLFHRTIQSRASVSETIRSTPDEQRISVQIPLAADRFGMRCNVPHCSNACSMFPISPSMQIAAVHASSQERIEIGGQFPGTLVITAAKDSFPQFQTAFGAEILRQRRGHHVCTFKVPARFQSDGPNEVCKLLVEPFKRVGFAGLCPPVQLFVLYSVPPLFRLKISVLALAVPWDGPFSQHHNANTDAP